MREATWQDRVDALGRGHYRRYDERTATEGLAGLVAPADLPRLVAACVRARHDDVVREAADRTR